MPYPTIYYTLIIKHLLLGLEVIDFLDSYLDLSDNIAIASPFVIGTGLPNIIGPTPGFL